MIIKYNPKKPVNVELNSIESQILSIRKNFDELQDMYISKKGEMSNFLEMFYCNARENFADENIFVKINDFEIAIKFIDDNIVSIIDLDNAGKKVYELAENFRVKKGRNSKKNLYSALESYNWLLNNSADKIEKNDNRCMSLISKYYNSKQELDDETLKTYGVPYKKVSSDQIQELISNRRSRLKSRFKQDSKLETEKNSQTVDNLVENLLKKYKNDKQIENNILSQETDQLANENIVNSEQVELENNILSQELDKSVNENIVNSEQVELENDILLQEAEQLENENNVCLEIDKKNEIADVIKPKSKKKKSTKSSVITKVLEDGTIVKMRKVKKDKNLKSDDYIIKTTKEGKKIKIRKKIKNQSLEEKNIALNYKELESEIRFIEAESQDINEVNLNEAYLKQSVTSNVFKKINYEKQSNCVAAKNDIQNIDESVLEITPKDNVYKFIEIDKGNDKKHKSSINLHEILDNNTLVISEKNGKIVLPYYISDVENLFISGDFTKKEVKELIDKKYAIPLKKYKNASVARFRETYNLLKLSNDMSTVECLKKSYEISLNSKLNPAIIMACKNRWELDTYVECLNNDELDKFNIFKIKYESYPYKKFKMKKSLKKE